MSYTEYVKNKHKHLMLIDETENNIVEKKKTNPVDFLRQQGVKIKEESYDDVNDNIIVTLYKAMVPKATELLSNTTYSYEINDEVIVFKN